MMIFCIFVIFFLQFSFCFYFDIYFLFCFEIFISPNIFYFRREIRSGETLESVINILPLQIGKLILDGFYLEENDDDKDQTEYSGILGPGSGVRRIK